MLLSCQRAVSTYLYGAFDCILLTVFECMYLTDRAPALSKVFLDIYVTRGCRFTLKLLRGMIITHS